MENNAVSIGVGVAKINVASVKVAKNYGTRIICYELQKIYWESIVGWVVKTVNVYGVILDVKGSSATFQVGKLRGEAKGGGNKRVADGNRGASAGILQSMAVFAENFEFWNRKGIRVF